MRGFTLIEIMMVVLIIGLLASLVGPSIFANSLEAQRNIALAKCNHYHGAVQMWMLHKRVADVPRSLDEIKAPLHPGDPNYLRVEPDPWGSPYRILHEGGRRFRVCSNGQDGIEGSEDDIYFEPKEDG